MRKRKSLSSSTVMLGAVDAPESIRVSLGMVTALAHGDRHSAGQSADDGDDVFHVHERARGVHALDRIHRSVAADDDHRSAMHSTSAVDVVGSQLDGVAKRRAKFGEGAGENVEIPDNQRVKGLHGNRDLDYPGYLDLLLFLDYPRNLDFSLFPPPPGLLRLPSLPRLPA